MTGAPSGQGRQPRLVSHGAIGKGGFGILISKDGEFYQIDWCLMDCPWEPDQEMEAKLANEFPFREVSEQRRDSFFFTSE
jgi:hypothetical protein